MARPASRSASQSGSSPTTAARLARIVWVALPMLRRSCVFASATLADSWKVIVVLVRTPCGLVIAVLSVFCGSFFVLRDEKRPTSGGESLRHGSPTCNVFWPYRRKNVTQTRYHSVDARI